MGGGGGGCIANSRPMFWILHRLVSFVCCLFVHFGAKAKENQDKVPTLYWLPKLHKKPYKARFNANSSSCTTTELSKL